MGAGWLVGEAGVAEGLEKEIAGTVTGEDAAGAVVAAGKSPMEVEERKAFAAWCDRMGGAEYAMHCQPGHQDGACNRAPRIAVFPPSVQPGRSFTVCGDYRYNACLANALPREIS